MNNTTSTTDSFNSTEMKTDHLTVFDQPIVVSAEHSVSVLGLTYIVKQWGGDWWKGRCCRPVQRKAVLRNVSVHLKSGELTAILGNSGSGKTSMLDVISSRTKGKIVGGVYLDNKLMTQDLFKHEASYVIQADRLLANLTVRETLDYTAKLKFSGFEFDQEAIRIRVEDVLKEMALQHIADARIGGAFVRGISGGEKRRVSIAVQLLQDPKLLLLDEPTTGLDTFTAHYLVSSLAELAKKKNKIILLTIHQPRSDIFKLFDQVCILSLGELVYCGSGRDLVPYFSSLGYHCPTYANPLDFFVDLASIDRRDSAREGASVERANLLKTAFVHSTIYRGTLANIHESTRLMDGNIIMNEPNPWKVTNPPGFFLALFTLVERMMINLYRDRSAFVLRIGQFAVFSVFIWLFLIRLKNNQESIQDRIGLFYQSVQVSSMIGLMNCVALFPQLRDLYYREARDGLYSGVVFTLSYFIHVFPFQVLSSIIFSSIIYWALGLFPQPERFGIYFTVVLLMHMTGELLGVTFMGVFRNPAVANSVTALLMALTGLISSGFLRNIESMLLFFQYISWLSIFKYGGEVLVANEFHLLELACDPGSNVPCLFPTGDTYINVFYPGAVDNLSRNLGVTGAFVIFFIILAPIVYSIRGMNKKLY